MSENNRKQPNLSKSKHVNTEAITKKTLHRMYVLPFPVKDDDEKKNTHTRLPSERQAVFVMFDGSVVTVTRNIPGIFREKPLTRHLPSTPLFVLFYAKQLSCEQPASVFFFLPCFSGQLWY